MSMSVFPVKRIKGMENWESSVTPEVIETAKNFLVTRYSEFSANTNFAGVGKEGRLEEFLSRVCHASISMISEDCREVLATSNMASKKTHIPIETFRPFVRWFLTDSPYSFIILNRDDLDFCEKYGFILAGDAPTTLVQSAAIISRHFAECSKEAFEGFNELTGRGIDPFISYQLCFNSNISAPNRRAEQAFLFESYGGHRVTHSLLPEDMLPYYTGEARGKLGRPFKEAPSIYGSAALFPGDNYLGGHLSMYRSACHKFHKFLLEEEGKLGKEDVYRPPNPFSPAAESKNEFKFTINQALNCVADYLHDEIKESLGV